MVLKTGTRRLISAGLLVGAMLAGPVVAEEASPIRDQDRSVYNTLFKDKLSTVDRTRSTADDATLAEEMMDFAENLPASDRGVRCLLYAEVIRLASNTADLGLMKQSLGSLQNDWAEQDLVTDEQLMQFANRAYKGVERRDRDEQGEHYIDMLLEIAKGHEDANEPDQAINVCRLANTIAKAIDSDQLEAIQDKLDRLDAANDMAKRIKMLELSVKKNPQNSPAARELIKLLITQHNDPQAAAEYVDSTKDEELIDLVHRCARGIDEANAAGAMRIGDWYVTLAEDEQDDTAMTLFQEARLWYEQFFALYRRDDALAKRVEEMDNLVLLRIERLIASNPELAKEANGGWESLIDPPYDAEKAVLRRPATLWSENGEITIEGGSLFIPYEPGKAYEVRITMTVNKDSSDEDPTMTVFLPIDGSRVLTTRYYVDHPEIGQVRDVRESFKLRPAPGKVGERHQLTFQIAETPGQLAYAMLYNGKAGLKWQGDMEELDKLDEDVLERLPEGVKSVMFLRFDGNITLHAVDYKARD